MEVVNGKIVSVRTQRSSGEGWSGLRPSRGLLAQSNHGNSDQLRGHGRELWAPSWDTPSNFSHENPPCGRGGPGAALSLGSAPNGFDLEAGAARWNQRPTSEMHHFGARLAYTGFQPLPVAEHRQGWGDDPRRHYHAGARPWSEIRLDRMMAEYESQITQAAPNHDASTSALGQENPTLPQLPVDESEEYSLQISGSDARRESGLQFIPTPTIVGSRSDLKRKRSEIICEEADQADCGWSHPLKLLVRKGLTVSDVGDLGRIIIPKRFAESRFQQISSKEGTILEMKDYSSSKRWFFRLKWWINNKSRMYVLENTGEFIKYYGLKEHDNFVVYEDGLRKLVVRGHKSGTDLDSTPEAPPKSHPAPKMDLLL